MDFAKIRPRGGTKAQWEKANPVLAKREIGVQWETTIGVGEVVIKIGDGVTDWINLPEAVKSDITKKIIAALAVVPDDDPDLADGDSLDTLFGKIAKKFKYLKDNKLDKSARYDGTDSTSTELVPTANALRGVNAKADKNASDITTLNNNLSNKADKTSLSSYALKSDLQSFLMYKEFTTEIRDWIPLKACRISHTTPTGYRFLAYCHTRTNGWIGSVYPSPIDNEMSDLWTSVGSGTGSVTLGILFVKAA